MKNVAALRAREVVSKLTFWAWCPAVGVTFQHRRPLRECSRPRRFRRSPCAPLLGQPYGISVVGAWIKCSLFGRISGLCFCLRILHLALGCGYRDKRRRFGWAKRGHRESNEDERRLLCPRSPSEGSAGRSCRVGSGRISRPRTLMSRRFRRWPSTLAKVRPGSSCPAG